jgi:DNA-binding CsgD family transcriptional regulator/putative methionine-R-sulfoxide reductase with GAF domain
MDTDLLQRLEELRAQVNVLNRAICLVLDDYEGIDEFLNQVVNVIREEMGYNHFGIGLTNEVGNVVLRAWYGIPEESTDQLVAVPGQGIVGWVLQDGKPLLVEDVRLEPRYRQWRSATLSELCVPLLARGQLIGVVNVESDQLARFSEKDLELLTTLAAVVSGTLRRIVERGAAAEQEKRKLQSLTARQREVLNEIVEGRSNKEIGEKLRITERTVETHLTNIFAKLGVRSRFEAALWGREHGLVTQ